MPALTKEQQEEKIFVPEISTDLVHWFKTEVTATLKTKRVKGADAVPYGFSDDKWHTVPTVQKSTEFVFPVIRVALINSVEQINRALADILTADQPGYRNPKALAEHLSYGLYTSTRARVTKGVDLTLTAAQQNAVKMFGNMVKEGLLDRQVAIEGLLKQGISSAEEVVDAFLRGDLEDSSMLEASNNGASA